MCRRVCGLRVLCSSVGSSVFHCLLSCVCLAVCVTACLWLHVWRCVLIEHKIEQRERERKQKKKACARRDTQSCAVCEQPQSTRSPTVLCTNLFAPLFEEKESAGSSCCWFAAQCLPAARLEKTGSMSKAWKTQSLTRAQLCPRTEVPRHRNNKYPPLTTFVFPATHSLLLLELRGVRQLNSERTLLCARDGGLARRMLPTPRRLHLFRRALNFAKVAQEFPRNRTRKFPPFFTCCELYRILLRSSRQPTSMAAGGWGDSALRPLVSTSSELPRSGFEPRHLRKNCGKALKKC